MPPITISLNSTSYMGTLRKFSKQLAVKSRQFVFATHKHFTLPYICYAMKTPFTQGDTKQYSRIINPTDIASFESGTVHEVYSTFAIARDAEWSGRLFVLEMKEDHEEGIGTFIHVNHISPAFVSQEITFVSTFEEITERKEIITSFKAYCDDRLIAEGKQGQKILPKEKIEQLFKQITMPIN